MTGLTDVTLDDDGDLTATATLPGDRVVAVLSEPEEGTTAELGAMRALVERALAPLGESHLLAADARAAEELAVEDGETVEVALEGVIVLPDAKLVLMYDAPGQGVTVFCALDDQLAVAEVKLDEDDEEFEYEYELEGDGDGVESRSFATMDELLDHLSRAEASERGAADADAENGDRPA